MALISFHALFPADRSSNIKYEQIKFKENISDTTQWHYTNNIFMNNIFSPLICAPKFTI
jgi:hypothetical protein